MDFTICDIENFPCRIWIIQEKNTALAASLSYRLRNYLFDEAAFSRISRTLFLDSV